MLAADMKRTIIENLNEIYMDQCLSGFLIKASILDPVCKSLQNTTKDGAILITKLAIRGMCINVEESNLG